MRRSSSALVRGAAVVLCLVTSGLASAQDAAKPVADPARIAAAKDLLQAMGGIDQARASISQFVEALIGEIAGKDQSIIGPASLFLRSETQPDRPRVKLYLAEVEEAAANFYATRFSAEEMKAIADFQRSPAGRKFQAETPQLMGVMVPLLTKFQQGLIMDMQKGLTAGRVEEPAGAPKPAAAPK